MAETACSGGNSRWNPTKEQISMLESLYKQGIRTPSADQIQQITGRLKAYGTIEGKNVFYWFQNHKARQRQKQKQENLAYINRYLHTPQPVYPPPVVRGPYFLPQVDHNLGFYPQCPKVLIPCGPVKKNGRPSGKMVKPIFYGGNAYDLMVHNTMMIQDTENYGGGCNDNGGNDHHETLDLFPLHPTGVSDGNSTLIASPNDSFVDQQSVTAGSDEHHFFDFLSCQASTHESVSKQ